MPSVASSACLATHAAFYLWYGTPDLDGEWRHWNHAVLPHWRAEVSQRYAVGVPFRPPDEPHSPFYPKIGLYSSKDVTILQQQLSSLAAAGIDSIMLSWWGQAALDIRRDSQGVSTDELVPAVLDVAAEVGIHVSWHIEPYGGRSPRTILADLRYLHKMYGAHPAVWRQPRASPGEASSSAPSLPLVFLYDVSAEHSASHPDELTEWREIVAELRGSPADAVLLSLFHDRRDVDFVQAAGFDGAYTYFAASGFTEGSNAEHWSEMRQRMAANGKLFYPSVGPGYNDTLIRPWNHLQTRERRRGAYYDSMWERALHAAPHGVTVTSFNEWGEGTQIEAARPHIALHGAKPLIYADYDPDPPDFYMERTRHWALQAKRGCGPEEDAREL